MDDPTISRRNRDMSVAINSITNMDEGLDELELPSDPDAQATVTDFLDFTEYLTADVMRSLTLIGHLDKSYMKTSADVHELTTQYGQQTSSNAVGSKIRADISQSLNQGLQSRTLAYAEADRMAEHVDRHYNRALSILTKLRAMRESYPESRESSPLPVQLGSPELARVPKITLRLDGARASAACRGAFRTHKHSAPRITVPGDVLAPYEFEYESFGASSDDSMSSDEEPLTPRYSPIRNPGNAITGRIKLKLNKHKHVKPEKVPRAPRPPGVMGTNVHSSVAGISTSNALAQLKPPPDDAKLGSEDAPWLKLTDWELAKLRKRMKKNAIWNPSDTMIARELKLVGRGVEAFHTEKARAEAAGRDFNPILPSRIDDGSGKDVVKNGAISIEALESAHIQLSNRGMQLNVAKKLKRENHAKELAKLAAEEAEESARKMAQAASTISNLFRPKVSDSLVESYTRSNPRLSLGKRKRESTADTTDTARGSVKIENEPHIKRSKIETPVPAPRSTAGNQTNGVSLHHTTSNPDSILSTEVTSTSIGPLTPSATYATITTTIPLRTNSPKKSSTPILPPTRDLKSRRPASIPFSALSGTPDPLPPRRTSSRPASRPVSQGNTVSVETVFGKDRPRRASTVHNTPAPESHPLRSSAKRSKRPAPGPVSVEGGRSAAVSVGKRSNAPVKKAGSKPSMKDEEKEVWDEVDDEGNIIPPDEPKYCVCNRVSFGTMIACENENCEKEWFHIECVGLSEVPPRTTKWYCPDCRVSLKIGSKGEVNARGKKK